MTTLEMESVLRMPVERRILWLEEVWDSIGPQSGTLKIPASHKKELDRRLKKYAHDSSALLSTEELKHAVHARK